MERRVIVEMNNQPLVSVPVITYNSSKFVLETLESIKAQTYQNIELIISDDCSTDNTVELCRKWVEENKERFVRTQIITSELNTGVSANLNRAEAACQGEWVKGIAGDDLLMPNCVESCIKYISEYPNRHFIFGRLEAFNENGVIDDYFESFIDDKFFDLSAEEQYCRLIMKGNCLTAPTLFYHNPTKCVNKIENDEAFALFEDYPKWINITKKGEMLYLLDSVIVRYRVNTTSISYGNSNPKFLRDKAQCYMKYCFNYELRKFPRQAIYHYLFIKRYLHPNTCNSCMLVLYESLEKLYRLVSASKPISKDYRRLYR